MSAVSLNDTFGRGSDSVSLRITAAAASSVTLRLRAMRPNTIVSGGPAAYGGVGAAGSQVDDLILHDGALRAMRDDVADWLTVGNAAGRIEPGDREIAGAFLTASHAPVEPSTPDRSAPHTVANRLMASVARISLPVVGVAGLQARLGVSPGPDGFAQAYGHFVDARGRSVDLTLLPAAIHVENTALWTWVSIGNIAFRADLSYAGALSKFVQAVRHGE